MEIFERYNKLVEQKKNLDGEILATQCEMYALHQETFDKKDVGTINVDDSGYRLTVVKKESVVVDQELASVVGVGFKKKFSLDKKAYNNLPIEEKVRVDECLTTKPAKPSFKVEKIDGN